MKKIFTLAAFAFVCSIVLAGNFDDYKNHIAPNRILIAFNKGVSVEQQEALIKASGLVNSFNRIPNPALSICFTDNAQQALAYFNAQQAVLFASFFITDNKEHYAGVLNQLFIKITDGNFEALLKDRLKELGLDAPVPDRYLPRLYKVTVPVTAGNAIDVAELLKAEAWVEYAAPNYLLNPMVNSNDPNYNREWNIHNTGSSLQGHGTPGADMKVDTAWGITTGDSTIKVAIIDSGVDTLHGDLKANLLPGHDAVSDSTDGYPTPNYPEDGHGTCCAGIVAAVKDNAIGCAGVAPGCKLIPVHTFYYENLQSSIIPYSTAEYFANAIMWACDSAHADIMSNSWGLPLSILALLPGGTQPVEDAIEHAYTTGRNGKGIAMFFSSGNDDDSIGPIWPAGLAHTIAVNATNMCDTRKTAGDCSGENWGGDWGTGLDFSAPGVKITTTDMRGTKGFATGDYYTLFNGTSAACPNAAAVGALVLSVKPNLGVEDVRNIIAQGCDKVGGYNYDSIYANGTWCRQLGYGRVNAYKAVLLAQNFTDVKTVEAEMPVRIYPNPTQGRLNIAYNGDEKLNMQLFDITGKQLLEKVLEKGLNTEDISALPGGIYLIRLCAGLTIVTNKVTVVR